MHAHIGYGPQVSDVLYILRDVATGLDVVHAHKARPAPVLFPGGRGLLFCADAR
jgi:hypothetical protein